MGLKFTISDTINSVCQKTSCLDGKIQFRGVLKKMILRFTGVNERLFFLTQRRKGVFDQTLNIKIINNQIKQILK